MATTPDERTYRAVFVRRGTGGWGKGLVLRADGTRNVVLSVTGGGIHPVAARIAELTGAEAIDGFTGSAPDERVLCAVINCGGTARIGVYPRKRIPTVDVYPGAPGGPLAQFITEDIFVSAVGPDDVAPHEGDEPSAAGAAPSSATTGATGATGATGTTATDGPSVAAAATVAGARDRGGDGGRFDRVSGFFVRFGSAIGYAVNTLLASGRQAINLTLTTVLPFMAYVSLLLGFVLYTGVARSFSEVLRPLAGNPIGLVVIGAIVTLPFLSPVLGPGAAIAQVIGVLMGTQIASGALPVQYALPTLFAINGQVGCDFIPVGLGLGEAKPETVAIGTPAVLFSRQLTSPLAVVIAWLASFGL
jgi:PTS system glucitol/sorbitol-specific IIC component